MAFCKFCGKEIPDGMICDCQGSQEQYQSSFDPMQSDSQNSGGGINDVVNNVKKNKNLQIIIAVVAVLLVIILLAAAGGSGYKKAVKKYFKASITKNGGKTFYSYILPDEAIKELKDGDEWDDMLEDYRDNMEDEIEDWDKKPKFKKISKANKMKNKELKTAEAYFYAAAKGCGADVDEDDFDVTKGYEVTYRYKDEDGDNEKETIYVVKLKGEGWKIMPSLTSYFSGLGSSYDFDWDDLF